MRPITEHNYAVKTVIVPAAGLGTRFLPATKTVPKELLPVVDTPGIELIAEEAAHIGAQRLAIINAPAKPSVLGHFQEQPELEAVLDHREKTDLLAKVRNAPSLLEAVGVIQEKPLGLGHAVGLAESILDSEEDAVAVMLPDDLVYPSPMPEMIAAREEFGGSVLCAFNVPREEVSNYGIFRIGETEHDNIKRVIGMVEKPSIEDAPSTFAAAGRYLLDRAIFDALRRITPGKGGELQLTDAIQLLIEEGHPVHIVIHEGKRHDLGNPGGYIKACVDFALESPVYGPSLKEYLKERLG